MPLEAMKDVAAYITMLGTSQAEKLVSAAPKPTPQPAAKPDTGTADAAREPAAKPGAIVANAAKGRTLFTTCIACHGPDARGMPALKAPSLAGQEEWYLVSQLQNFKNGIRGVHPKDAQGLIMRPMAATLVDDQAVHDVAAYIATLPPGKPAGATLGGDANKGKILFGTCIACHGPTAHGIAALKAPALAGQADWYLVTQLQNFKAGHRGTDPKDTQGLLMRPMAATLATDQAVKDVAAYISSLPPKPASKK